MKERDITIPLEEWAEHLIDRALAKHRDQCPLYGRVRKLEIRFALLIGYMVGSGLVGGIVGALLSRIVVA